MNDNRLPSFDDARKSREEPHPEQHKPDQPKPLAGFTLVGDAAKAFVARLAAARK